MVNDRADSAVVEVFDQAASTYDRTGVTFFGPFGAELVRRAAIRPGDRVLDVGCGRGAVLFPAAHATGPAGQVLGIDLAPAMVELTRQDVAEAGLRHVSVQIGDAQDPELPETSFDVVLAGLVVFLLPDPPGALSAYARLLRPNGRLGISTLRAQDSAFIAAMDALAAHLPADRPRPAPAIDPFADGVAITATLASAGLTPIAIDEVRVESRFHDVDHWMAWMWSHGGRALLRHIPQERLAAATADAAAALGQAQTSGGDIVLTTTARITTAETAAGP
jgi:ubiquinone/menaquinone biosynthesis C-methylase UbiE